VAANVPTVMLRYHLGNVHVGTSDEDVIEEVRRAIQRAAAANGPEAAEWTGETIRQTLAAALWLHHENRAEYTGVMSGTF